MKTPDYKQAENLCFWLALGGCAALGFGARLDAVVLMVFGLVLLVCALYVMLRFCRCPHCGAYLGRASKASFCPHCGEKLK